MSAAIATPPRKRFTRAEVERMLAAGVFEGQRFELIDGDLIDKMGQPPPHAIAVANSSTWLFLNFNRKGQVRVQLPMDVSPGDRDRSEPEPDFVVIGDEVSLINRHPRGDEALLVIEVADSTVRFDLTVKRDLYARANVREYWVLDIPKRELVIHRNPQAGQYTGQHRLTEHDLTSPVCRPEAAITVADLLP